VAIIDPGDDGLERAEESASANALDYVNLNLNNLRLRAKRPVADALIAASCTRTVEGPSTLVLTFDDKDLALLRAGAIDINEDGRLDPIEVTLDTLTWRIVKAESSWSADASQLRLTFEEQACALLKSHNAHLVVSRANKTRAEFAHRLVQEVKAKRLAFFSPEEHFQPAVAKTPRDKKSRDSQAKPGFADNVKLKIKGATASNDQLQEIETSLKVADEENATGRARQAQMCAAIAESGFRAIRNLSGSKYSGVYQADPAKIDPKDTESQARHFLRGGLGFQGGGAIAAAAAHPDWSPGRIALEVEGSIQNFGGDIAKGTAFYQVGDDPQHSHISEAKAIISAWTGSADGTPTERTVIKPYQFTRGLPGKRETSWETLQRLAEEVGWRCFVVGGVVYFISEEQLFMSRARAEIGIDLPGLVSLEADWDDGKVVKQITLTVDAGRWAFRPGSIIALRDLGPLNGRWLVHTIDRPSLFDPATEITLTKPIARKKEPAADTIQVSRDVTDDAAKGVDAAYAAAKHLADLKIPYVWGGGHSEDLDDYNPNGGFDCSSGVSIVLHRAGLFDSDHAITSGELAKWGTPGKGRQLTVYANANHVFMVFDLPGKKPQAWEFRHTGTVGGFSGRAQNPGFENGFVARHAPGT
jgi:cell wall-associated NlpC family hydrolase